MGKERCAISAKILEQYVKNYQQLYAHTALIYGTVPF